MSPYSLTQGVLEFSDESLSNKMKKMDATPCSLALQSYSMVDSMITKNFKYIKVIKRRKDYL